VLFAFTAEVGSTSEESLNLLSSWTAAGGEQGVAGAGRERSE
jgi:hypothetical protein